MPRIVIFLTVVVAVLGAIHFYFWVRLVRDTALPAPWRAWAGVALASLAASIPLLLLATRKLPTVWLRPFAWPAFMWLGLMLLVLLFVVGGDVVRLCTYLGIRVMHGPQPLDPQRRVAMARAGAAVAGTGAALVAAFSLRQALRALTVNEIKVQLARLPAQSNGTTIVQLTDMHIGPLIGAAFVEEVVRKTNALSPDIIAITGDLVDGSVEDLRSSLAPLADLRARHGVFFVTGNHEYYSGAAEWIPALTQLGIRVLGNQHVPIGDAVGPGGFDLAGVHDFSAARRGAGLRPDLPAALAGRDASRELILLAHQPRAVLEAARLGVGLQLSGHTHAGQMWPFHYLVRLQQPYIAGLHRHGGTQIYVSPGTGYWGPPMRLGTQAEITRITLLSARLDGAA